MALATMFTFTLIVALLRPTVGVTFQRTEQNVSIRQRPNAHSRTRESPGACTPEELQSKELDIVLFGASGTLGKYFAEYMAGRPGMVSWAMSGRDRNTLQTLKQSINGGPNVKIIEADYEQIGSLNALAKRAKVVLNTAGPFETNGAEALIRASIENCAHYVDVAGETHWRAEMLYKYGAQAEARGVTMTQGAGHVSLFADFLALSSARDVSKDGQGPPKDVFITFTKMNGAPGGGSLASAQQAWEKYGPVTDPYILVPEATDKEMIDRELDGIDSFGFHPGVNLKLMVYAGSRMDCPVARRSMHIEYGGVPVKVHESEVSELMDGLKTFLSDQRIFANPPPMMPGTHTEPPKWIIEEGGFAAEAWSVRKKDGKASRVKMSGKGDPAFKGSARMTSELVIALATNGPYNGRTGYLSPAQLVDTAELERLWKAIDGGRFCTITHAEEHTSHKPRNTEFEGSEQPEENQPATFEPEVTGS